MDLDGLKRRCRVALKRAADVIDPTARVVAEVGEFVTALQRPLTPIGAATAVARGVTTLNDWVSSRPKPGSVGTHFGERTSSISRWILPILTEWVTEESGGEDFTRLYFDRWEAVCTVTEEGPYFFRADPVYRTSVGEISDETMERIREEVYAELRSRLPMVLDVALHTGDSSESVLDPVELDGLPSPRADEVYDATLPLLGSGRCILLDGPPGTGKTRMARYLAGRFADGGRVISLRFDLAPDMDEYEIGMIVDVIRPDVVLIDDIDKLENDLGNVTLERLRAGSRLVILTANSATEVLDGSLLRPGRVDEMFTIDDIGVELIDPEWMERLDDMTVERIKGWPAADLAEVRNRLEARGPDGLELDELETRMLMDVHSGGRFFRRDE